MTKLLRIFWPHYVLSMLTLLLATNAAFAQAPNLGTAATYGAFSGSGAIGNTGLTMLTGDIGTYVGSFTGFPPGLYSGAKHVADAAALTAKNDLTLAYNSLNDATHAVIYDTVLNATMGNGQVLTPRTYRRGDLTTLSGNLTFDAKGNSAAVFIIKIGAALNVAKNTTIILANSAQAANIYWAVDGAVSILDNTVFKGTILANGAIHLYGGASLEGRALAVVGAITMASNLVSVPGSAAPNNYIIVITPAPGDTIRGGTQSYQITWGGSGITSQKTFEYSLDSGAAWTLIGTVTSDAFAYTWNVPDTASKKALVRITDHNNLRGVSGLFTIRSSKIVVTHPAYHDTIPGGTQNYQITWTGVGLATQKTFDLSLDSGLTWKTIGTITADVNAYSWNVPDTNSAKAIVRITDKSGITGKSGVFSIRSSKIVVLRPALGETIIGGTANYQITWSGSNIATQKTFEYSLDSGLTWKTIGVLNTDVFTYSWNVPDTTSIKAFVRITDRNGVIGKSGLFSILTSKIPVIVVLRPAEGETVPGGKQNYQITWTGSLINAQKTIELSLNGAVTWTTIGTLNADVFTYLWNVPDTTSTRAFIRITDKNGLTGLSGLFTILSSKVPVIVVTHPTAGERIPGDTQGYQITWTGSGIATKKTFELSLDSGATFPIMIGTLHSDALTYSWNVPDTASTKAMIRITDSNGLRGKSGVFTISAGSINSLTLSGLTNNNIGNGKTLGITWTFTPYIGTSVLVEYLLNSQSQWTAIATVPTTESPNTSMPTPMSGYYSAALIRVTSTKGMRKTSAAFSIGTAAGVASDPRAMGYSLTNYPNPASDQTTISFTLPVSGDVTLIVSDAVGRELMNVEGTQMAVGTHTVHFNATGLASGAYTYRLMVGTTMLTGRMDIVR